MSAPLSLPGLTQFLSRLEDYPRLLEAVDQGKQTIALSGLSAVHRAYLAAALHQSTGRPLTLVCPDDGEARRLAGDLSAFTGRRCRFSCPDFLFTPGPPPPVEHQRLKFWPGSTGTARAGGHRGACSSGPCLCGLRRQLPPAPWARSVSRRGSPTFWSAGYPVRPGGGDRAVRPAGAF
ncbi:MAG: hypothetical protein ACLSTT_05010 [Evtepia gabavorous]